MSDQSAGSVSPYRQVVNLIGAYLGDIRNDEEYRSRTSKGTGLRYAETVLEELFEKALEVQIDSSGGKS